MTAFILLSLFTYNQHGQRITIPSSISLHLHPKSNLPGEQKNKSLLDGKWKKRDYAFVAWFPEDTLQEMNDSETEHQKKQLGSLTPTVIKRQEKKIMGCVDFSRIITLSCWR